MLLHNQNMPVNHIEKFSEALEAEVLHVRAKNGKISHSKKSIFFFEKKLIFSWIQNEKFSRSSPLYEGLHFQGPLKSFNVGYRHVLTTVDPPQMTDVFRAFFSTLPSVLNDQNFAFIISL